ncbi:MAG: elongation factor G [Desulfonauticus sp.]|nr:elongation factor G [Desulfonauticus sp.]
MSVGQDKYLQQIRNIGIIAHIDAGKTTLTERILFYSQKIHRMGEVHEGTATMDYLPQEQERGITITSACTTLEWNKNTLNLIDTPGHVDFTIEVERALRVLDGVVAVFCGVGGVEPQSETVWRQSEHYKIPKLAFINKMDRPGADFDVVLNAMRKKLQANPVVVQAPLGSGDELRGILDILRKRKLVFHQETQGKTFDVLALLPEEQTIVDRYRADLLEKLADFDEVILEKYLQGEEIPLAHLKMVLRRLTLAGKVVPVLGGSALKNVGIQPVLDAVVDFLPSPLDVPQLEGKCPLTGKKKFFPISSRSPLSALVFKISLETGRRLVLVRIYSGSIKPGDVVYNVSQQKQEKIARMFKLHANRKEKLDQARAGEIVALAGLKFAKTGDTLCQPEDPILLEKIEEYKPVISLALEPQNASEEEKMAEVLERFLQEDPTLKMGRDENTGQFILSGMGELHLEVVLNRMNKEYGLQFRAGKPQVIYLETITQKAEAEADFTKVLGDKLHAGWVRLSIAPVGRGQGIDVKFALDKTKFDEKILESVVQSINDSLSTGPIKGYPVCDVQVVVEELRTQEGSSEIGFRMAAIQALKLALEKAKPVLLEPLMWLEIYTPEEFLGECIHLINSKKGKIEAISEKVGVKVIQSIAPLENLFGFSTALRSATQGRANVTMRFYKFDKLS